MRILISNDDGISAPGLHALVRAFHEAGHEVAVAAPDAQRSAASHSLTMRLPLIPRATSVQGAVLAYAINGTPVDCVKLALDRLYPQAEFVVSGINHGYNLGTDVLYSGTVAAAMEGSLCGLPAMAVSLGYTREDTYDLAARLAVNMLEIIKRHPLPDRTILNLNYPEVDRALGVKAVPLKATRYTESYTECENERVGKYYWLSGGIDDRQEPGDDDFTWLKRGYAAVTVVTSDMTAYDATKKWRDWIALERPLLHVSE